MNLAQVIGGVYKDHSERVFQNNPLLQNITTKIMNMEQLTPDEAESIKSKEALVLCEEPGYRIFKALELGVNTDFMDVVMKHENHPSLEFTDIFRVSCSAGHLHIAQWSLKQDPALDYHNENEYAFRWACYNGHLHVAKWLVKTFPDIDYRINNDEAFRFACQNGHLDVVMWLVGRFPNTNYRACDDEAFRFACQNGHLPVSRWLVGRFPDINYRARDDFAFRWACYYGRLNVARWLKENYPDVDHHACNNQVLKDAYRNRHDDIFEWLITLPCGCSQR